MTFNKLSIITITPVYCERDAHASYA